MKIVISGGGEIGLMFIRAMVVEHDIYVIEFDTQKIEQLEPLDVQVINGNPTSLKSLKEAEVETADVFIASMPSDEVNILSCLAVKQISKAKTYCFVNKSNYFETFAGELGEHLVIDRIIWPEKLLGQHIANIIRVPGAIDVKVFERENLKVFECKLKENDKYVGQKFVNIKIPGGALAVAIFRNEEVVIPSGQTQLEVGDKIVFLGHEKSIKSIEGLFNPLSKQKFNIVIVGGGNIGSTLIESLTPYGNIGIKLVEKSYNVCQKLSERFGERVLVLHTDGTDSQTLKSIQIDQFDCLVALTGSDERNLFVALHAKKMNVRKVITRVYSKENIDFFESLGIDVALSARHSAIQEVMRQLNESFAPVFTIIEKGKAVIKEIKVSENFKPMRIMDLKMPPRTIIAAIKRGGRTIVPGGADKIKPDDCLRVFQTPESEGKLEEFLNSLIEKKT